MTSMRRLHIDRVSGTTFGRFSNRSIELGHHDFIVIHGPNESGKSTLSELIAWMVAGRHGMPVDTMKYGMKGERIGGAVSGTFDGNPFSINRTFKVRDSNTGKAPAETDPVITLGGRSIALPEWEDLIAVASAQDFALRYRVTDSDGPISVRELLESLAVGARIGLTPSAAMALLEELAGQFISAPSGRNASTEVARLRREMDEARRAHEEALAASRTIDDESNRLTDILGRSTVIETLIRDAISERDAIVSAADLLGVRRKIEEGEIALAAIGDIPTEWMRALHSRSRVEALVSELRVAEQTRHQAVEAYETARSALGINPSTAETLSLNSSVEQEVTTLTLSIEGSRDAISKAHEAIRIATVSLERNREDFRNLAGEMGLAVGEAESIASPHIDEVAFNDSISRWLDAAKEVIAAGAKVKPAMERAEQHRVNLDRAQRAWDILGLPTDPEHLHRSGSGYTTVIPRTRWSGLSRFIPAATVGLGVVIAVTMANKWAGVAATLAIAAALVTMFERRRIVAPVGQGPSLLGLAEATALVNARAEHVMATTSLADITSAHQHALALERDHGRVARETLRHMGISECTGPEHAGAIRRKRAALASVHNEIRALESVISNDESLILQSTTRLAEAEARLSQLATECGTPQFGARFDHHIVARIRDILAHRDAATRAYGTLADARARLTELIGESSLTELSGETLASELQRVADIASSRRTVEATLAALRERLTLASRDNALLRTLLDDASISTASLTEKVKVVDQRLDDLRIQLAALTEESGATKSRIAALESRADLPEINYRLSQADAQLREAATLGVARWFARKVVSEIKDEYERDNQPSLVRQAGELAHRATRGQWRSLRVSEDGAKLEVLRNDSSVFPESALSAGARDLLRLAVRISVADAHGERHQVSLPLICDDPTGVIDSLRTPEVYALLAECSQRRQVIVMTHDERAVELAVAAGAVSIDING